MYAFMKLNEFKLDNPEVLTVLKDYSKNALDLQSKTEKNGFDVRVEPKFEIPSGDVWVGSWCRPQIDGSALRVISLIKFANMLLDNQKEKEFNELKLYTDSLNDHNGGSIIFDLQ